MHIFKNFSLQPKSSDFTPETFASTCAGLYEVANLNPAGSVQSMLTGSEKNCFKKFDADFLLRCMFFINKTRKYDLLYCLFFINKRGK